MSTYLLDTDTLVFLIRGRKARLPVQVRSKAERIFQEIRGAQSRGDTVAVSAITCGELEYGVEKSLDPQRERLALGLVLAPFEAFSFDAADCARDYGAVRASLEAARTAIGAMDLLIAAHAKLYRQLS